MYEDGYINNFGSLMQVYVYKNIENNRHSFENLSNLCCFKDAISNFVSFLQRINKEKNFLPELIYIQELDCIVFKMSTSDVNIKENLSLNSNENFSLIYNGSNKEFLHTFKRINFVKEIFVGCFFLISFKLLDMNQKAFIISINMDLTDICFNPALNIITAISSSKILVFENNIDKILLSYKSLNCDKNDTELNTYNKTSSTFCYLTKYYPNSIQKNCFKTDKKEYDLSNDLIYQFDIEQEKSLIMEEINNEFGQIFASYNPKSNKIFVFERLFDLKSNNKANFILSEMKGHEANIVNIKAHRNYSKNNNVLISLCKNNTIIVWKINSKEIVKKIELERYIKDLNFFIFELNVLRNDCIFLFCNNLNKLKLLNLTSGVTKELFVDNVFLKNNNKYKILVSHNKEGFFSVEISNDNLFTVNKYTFKIKENFLY